MNAWLETALHVATRGLEIAGIAAIVIGAITATLTFIRQRSGPQPAPEAFNTYRSTLGRAILLGLEFLVAADIINTVAIEPSLNSLAILAGIVLIRTFLSVSLEVEIEGRWPWQAKHAGQPDSTSG
jgi:uncharacterized membrane protein